MVSRGNPVGIAAFAVVLSSIAACGGRGSAAPGPSELSCGTHAHLEGNVCVGDSAEVEVRSSDSLIIGPEGSGGTVGLVLGTRTLACLELQLLRSDGTLSPIGKESGAIVISTGNPGVAVAAGPDDCSLGGVIGLAQGTSALRVRLTTSSGVVEGAIPVSVKSGTLELKLVPTTIIPGEQPFAGLEAQASGDLPWYVRFVPAWLSLQVTDASIAQLGQGSQPGTLTVKGLARGKTQVSGTYGPPGASAPIPSAELTVLGPIQSVTPQSIAFTTLAGTKLETYPAVAPGTCFSAELIGQFVDDLGNTYSGRVGTGVSWSSTTGTVTLSGASIANVCAIGTGDALLKACVGTSCTFRSFPVFESGAVKSLSVTFGSTTPVKHQYSPYNVFCADLEVRAAMSDGSTRDITDSPAARYSLPSIGTPGNWVTRMFVEGVAYRNPAGWPCFEAGSVTSSATTVATKVSYTDKFTELSFAVTP